MSYPPLSPSPWLVPKNAGHTIRCFYRLTCVFRKHAIVKTMNSETTAGNSLVTRIMQLHSIDSSVPSAGSSTCKGSVIGVSDNTGSCLDGHHIHFRSQGADIGHSDPGRLDLENEGKSQPNFDLIPYHTVKASNASPRNTERDRYMSI